MRAGFRYCSSRAAPPIPDANAEACRAARLLAEWSGAPDVEVGFTGVTWPSVPDALDRMARLGHQRVALFFWFLATGKLVERARDQVSEFIVDVRGVDVLDAGYFGPDPDLVAVIEQRRLEAIDGVHRTNCDTCCYRAAWPGQGGPRRPTTRGRAFPSRCRASRSRHRPRATH